MSDKGEDYIKALQARGDDTASYYKKSQVKTEQQKFLEELLAANGRKFSNVADIACGGGTLTYHLRQIYPTAHFTLSDFNHDALKIAKELNGESCAYRYENIYELGGLSSGSFDLVCCWQTLSWLDDPATALQQLVRIAKPGGFIYASSLFNVKHDVDIYAKFRDYSKDEAGIEFSYNTYSAKTVGKWLEGKVKKWKLHEFVPQVDFHHDGRGIGTYTVKTGQQRLQVSAGYLMNWFILEIEK